MPKYLFLIAGLAMIGWIPACAPLEKEAEEETPEPLPAHEIGLESFRDGFEDVDAAGLVDDDRWTDTQIISPALTDNKIQILDIEPPQGEQVLGVDLTAGSESEDSAANLVKQGFRVYEGDRIRIEFFLRVPNWTRKTVLFADLECLACWDTTSGLVNTQPGIRLGVTNMELFVDRSKIGAEDWTQESPRPLTAETWTHIEWLVEPAVEGGRTVVKQDGVVVLDQNGPLFPVASVFAENAQNAGVNFVLQEPLFYEQVQIGVTGSRTADGLVMFDDVRIEVRTGIAGDATTCSKDNPLTCQ